MRRRLERIYRRHRQGLFTVAMAITRNADAAEDAIQEAFACLCRRTERPAPGDPTAYAFAAVRNAALDRVRRRKPQAASLEQESIFDGKAGDPAASAADAELAEELRRAVDALPGPQRETVAMRTFAGLTFQQIADALGEPLPTVTSRYRRALDALEQKCRRLL